MKCPGWLLLVLAVGLALPAEAEQRRAAAGTIDFFFHGHEDDWQIFMAPAAQAAAQAGHPVVFVYATAGDAGMGEKYWNARETAATASQNLLAGEKPGGSPKWYCTPVDVSGHKLRRCTLGIALKPRFTAYFLRGPDGGHESTNGCGYQVHDYQSLTRLMGIVCDAPLPAPMAAIDHSTVYQDFADFWQTLRGIVLREAQLQGTGNISVNAPDYNTTINAGDHRDHVATGQAVKCARDGSGELCGAVKLPKLTWPTRWYVGYGIGAMAKNISAADFVAKSSKFLAYDRAMYDAWNGVPCTEKPCVSTLSGDYVRYSDWLFRLYSRTDF
jgi:hypothetical protein